jgi:hypothetical protein
VQEGRGQGGRFCAGSRIGRSAAGVRLFGGLRWGLLLELGVTILALGDALGFATKVCDPAGSFWA